ncbi:hypothetical protein [Oceanivirga salmonicida]|uniref:hypothetical protein n=1 Tax=Oceanivirga salmonicida TaxID=1769291 RepID=UPI00083637C1|nr:hypothetical protein [Oceanivirga salmonicida]
MKKLIMMLFLTISMLTFSLENGKYEVEENISNDTIYVMNIIVSNNNIVSVNFDIKDSNGRSRVFGDKKLRDQIITFKRSITSGEDIFSQTIFDDSVIENHSKELLQYLIEKSQNGETGHFFK